MDPQSSLMNETTSFNLSEIWPIQMNAGAGGAALDLRRSPFGPNSGWFVEPGSNLDVSGNDGVAARKRRENVEDGDSGKGGACNGMVFLRFIFCSTFIIVYMVITDNNIKILLLRDN